MLMDKGCDLNYLVREEKYKKSRNFVELFWSIKEFCDKKAQNLCIGALRLNKGKIS